MSLNSFYKLLNYQMFDKQEQTITFTTIDELKSRLKNNKIAYEQVLQLEQKLASQSTQDKHQIVACIDCDGYGCDECNPNKIVVESRQSHRVDN